jgi:hypothetical protein
MTAAYEKTEKVYPGPARISGRGGHEPVNVGERLDLGGTTGASHQRRLIF